MQTNREFERHEKILEFENTMSMTLVLTCSTCMENHLNHVSKEMKEGFAHVCSGCQKKPKGYWLKNNLQSNGTREQNMAVSDWTMLVEIPFHMIYQKYCSR